MSKKSRDCLLLPTIREKEEEIKLVYPLLQEWATERLRFSMGHCPKAIITLLESKDYENELYRHFVVIKRC